MDAKRRSFVQAPKPRLSFRQRSPRERSPREPSPPPLLPQPAGNVVQDYTAAFAEKVVAADRNAALREAPAEVRRLLVYAPRLLGFAHRGLRSIRHPRLSFAVWESRIAHGAARTDADAQQRRIDALASHRTVEDIGRWATLGRCHDVVVASAAAATDALSAVQEHPHVIAALRRLWERLVSYGHKGRPGLDELAADRDGQKRASRADAAERRPSTAARDVDVFADPELRLSYRTYVHFETRLYRHLYHPLAVLDAVEAIDADYRYDAALSGPRYTAAALEALGGEADPPPEPAPLLDADTTLLLAAQHQFGLSGEESVEAPSRSGLLPPSALATDQGKVLLQNAELYRRGVSFAVFRASLLELADNWTGSCYPEEYAAFLFDLLLNCFADPGPDPDAPPAAAIARSRSVARLMRTQSEAAARHHSEQRALSRASSEPRSRSPSLAVALASPVEEGAAQRQGRGPRVNFVSPEERPIRPDESNGDGGSPTAAPTAGTMSGAEGAPSATTVVGAHPVLGEDAAVADGLALRVDVAAPVAGPELAHAGGLRGTELRGELPVLGLTPLGTVPTLPPHITAHSPSSTALSLPGALLSPSVASHGGSTRSGRLPGLEGANHTYTSDPGILADSLATVIRPGLPGMRVLDGGPPIAESPDHVESESSDEGESPASAHHSTPRKLLPPSRSAESTPAQWAPVPTSGHVPPTPPGHVLGHATPQGVQEFGVPPAQSVDGARGALSAVSSAEPAHPVVAISGPSHGLLAGRPWRGGDDTDDDRSRRTSDASASAVGRDESALATAMMSLLRAPASEGGIGGGGFAAAMQESLLTPRSDAGPSHLTLRLSGFDGRERGWGSTAATMHSGEVTASATPRFPTDSTGGRTADQCPSLAWPTPSATPRSLSTPRGTDDASPWHFPPGGPMPGFPVARPPGGRSLRTVEDRGVALRQLPTSPRGVPGGVSGVSGGASGGVSGGEPASLPSLPVVPQSGPPCEEAVHRLSGAPGQVRAVAAGVHPAGAEHDMTGFDGGMRSRSEETTPRTPRPAELSADLLTEPGQVALTPAAPSGRPPAADSTPVLGLGVEPSPPSSVSPWATATAPITPSGVAPHGAPSMPAPPGKDGPRRQVTQPRNAARGGSAPRPGRPMSSRLHPRAAEPREVAALDPKLFLLAVGRTDAEAYETAVAAARQQRERDDALRAAAIDKADPFARRAPHAHHAHAHLTRASTAAQPRRPGAFLPQVALTPSRRAAPTDLSELRRVPMRLRARDVAQGRGLYEGSLSARAPAPPAMAPPTPVRAPPVDVRTPRPPKPVARTARGVPIL